MLQLPKFVRWGLTTIILLFVCGFTECYKPVTDTNLPKGIKTVAVPAFQFESSALRFKVESRFTRAVITELIKRGHGLKVQGEREDADAVVEGSIKSFNFSGVLLDSKGRARVFEVTINAAVTVRDQRQNKVLYDNQNYIFRDSFEFTDDPRSFFNEEDPAVDRMARSFAESVVSTLINGFGVNQEK
ncbi:MAG: LptE family protein [Pyrinomonadaceae bacterium]